MTTKPRFNPLFADMVPQHKETAANIEEAAGVQHAYVRKHKSKRAPIPVVAALDTRTVVPVVSSRRK